jgi:hypothetical protein
VIRVHWRAGLADVLRLLHAEHRGARLLLLLMVLRLLVPLAPRPCAEWSARGWRTKHSRFRAHALAAKYIYIYIYLLFSSSIIDFYHAPSVGGKGDNDYKNALQKNLPPAHS